MPAARGRGWLGAGLLALALLLPRLADAQAPGLVAAYGFDEGTGATVLDASGNGNNGSISGATWTSSGRFGPALSFDGANDVVVIPDAGSLDLTSGMTLEAWVYPSSGLSSWKSILQKAVDAWFLNGNTGGNRLGVGGTFAGVCCSVLEGPSGLPVGEWTHVAGTYDGTTLSLYVNGALVASQPKAGSLQVTAAPLHIGGNSYASEFFPGRIDEVRIYDRALTPAEIQTDMNTPVGPGAPDPTPPTVALASPGPGSTNSHVTAISATASDDVGVTSVEFFVDAASLGTDFSAPWYASWNTTLASNGPHTLTAVARDAAGNAATSPAVAVNVSNPAFVNEVVVPDLAFATTLVFLPDGRMLIGELIEKIWVVQPGAAVPDPVPFLEIDASLLFGEQGLMDIALDPGFAQNGYYYVFHTRGLPQGNRNRVSRFTASGNATLPGSEFVVWQDDLGASAEHHGGALGFGPDGKLYVSTGEHFVPTDSQRLDTQRGKILRINSDGTIPTDNPFFDGNGPNKDAIWALGLRNPYRMSFDPVTGRLFIGDVGGNDHSTAMEEVNLGIAGANYGWPLCEGPCSLPGITSPVHSYPHAGSEASITGGFIYRGSAFPSEYQGNYFFGDFAQNTLSRLILDGTGSVATVLDFWPSDGTPDGPQVGDPVKMIEGPDGALYFVDIGFDGVYTPNPAAIRRIRYALGNQPPVAAANAAPLAGLPPLSVSFSSVGSFDPEGQPLTYAWTFGDGSTSDEASPAHVYQTAGLYVARLSVSDGSSATLSNDLTITVGNPPTATITTPSDGHLFRAGDSIPFAGSASDPDEGPLGAQAFSWTLSFLHESHAHPAGTLANTTTGVLQIPSSGHDFQGETRYQIALTVTDSDGLATSTSVTVFPDKVNLSFDSVPSGLNLEVDGITKQTPFVLDDVKGFQHTISAPDPSGGSYVFASWSDGGAQTHGIVAPDSDASLVATYQSTSPQPEGLVAAYSFDEGTGGTALDASGNGNHGSISGATWTSSGRYGPALSFDGANDAVVIPDASSLDVTSGLTLEAWVYPTSPLSGWKAILQKAVDAWFLNGNTSGNRVGIGGTFAGACCTVLSGPSGLPVNQWTHVAGTYDGATLRLYVNGALVASQARTGNLEVNTAALHIGGNTYAGEFFPGQIDEVRIYDRALTLGEIQTDMNSPISAPPAVPAVHPVLVALALGTSGAVLLARRSATARRRG